MVVQVADDDGIDFHRREAQLLCKRNARERGRQTVPAGDAFEVVWIKRIEAEADPAQAGGTERGGVRGEVRPVGGHRQIADALDGRKPGHQIRHSSAQERLAPGNADLLDAQPDGNPHDPLDFLVGKQRGLGLPFAEDGREGRLRVF